MRIQKEFAAADHGQQNEIKVTFGVPSKLEPQQALLQAKQALLYAAKALEGADVTTSFQSLTHSGPNTLQRAAQHLVTHKIPFKEAARLLYELGTTGKLPSLKDAARLTFTLDMLAAQAWSIDSRYDTSR